MTLAEMQAYSRRKASRGWAEKSAKKQTNEQLHARLLEAVEKYLKELFSNQHNTDAFLQAKNDLQAAAALSRKYGFPK